MGESKRYVLLDRLQGLTLLPLSAFVNLLFETKKYAIKLTRIRQKTFLYKVFNVSPRRTSIHGDSVDRLVAKHHSVEL